jgi:hypothetical protein
MNTMNKPGFTAEASLYRTNGRYQMAGARYRVELNASLVQPSAAIYVGGRFVCDGEVTANGFIDCYPLPGGGPLEELCGPCIRGRQRCIIPGVGSYSQPCGGESL